LALSEGSARSEQKRGLATSLFFLAKSRVRRVLAHICRLDYRFYSQMGTCSLSHLRLLVVYLSLLPFRSRHVAPPHEFSNVTEILLGPQTDPKLDAIRADKPRCLDLPTTYPAIDSIPADAQLLRCLNCRIRFHLLLC